MTGRFADRLDPAGFADDEPVEFRVTSDPPGTGAPVPDGVAARLQTLGTAYRLHVLDDVLRRYETVELDVRQAEGLLDELEFLVEVVDDPVLAEAVATLRPVVLASIRSGRSLTVDWDI